MECQEFVPFVTKFWKSNVVQGKYVYVLKENLKGLKESLRRWKKEVLGTLDLEV